MCCNRQMNGRTDGQTDGRTDRQTDGWADMVRSTRLLMQINIYLYRIIYFMRSEMFPKLRCKGLAKVNVLYTKVYNIRVSQVQGNNNFLQF